MEKRANTRKRYIYRKKATPQNRTAQDFVIGGVRNYIRQKNELRRLSAKNYRNDVKNIATKPAVQKMRQFNHHSHTNCFEHSVHVSYMNYLICRKFGWDVYSAAKAGLLHDMFLYDWHDFTPAKGERLHGFEHPSKALKNAHDNFELTRKEGDMIAKHMFPLTLTPPSYKETYVIVMTDKLCSVGEVLDRFFRTGKRIKKKAKINC